jgi:hypothetical protein
MRRCLCARHEITHGSPMPLVVVGPTHCAFDDCIEEVKNA